MTTTTAPSSNESFPIGIPSATTGSGSACVVWGQFEIQRPVPLPNTQSLSAVLARYTRSPDKAQLLTDARRTVAKTVYADEPDTLTALRLSHGLSQAQLAVLADTTQPYIARIERGQTDPSTDIISRIAKALGVPETQAFQSIRNQVKTRGQQS